MSSGELILTLFVALLVFGPQKMPMLARHLAALIKQVQAWRQQALALWNQLQLQNQLQSNLEKAKVADEHYSQYNGSPSPEIPTSRGLTAGSRNLSTSLDPAVKPREVDCVRTFHEVKTNEPL